MSALDAGRLLRALGQRLGEAAGVLLDDPDGRVGGPPGRESSRLLPLLADHCLRTRSVPATWLFLVAVTARLPDADDVREFVRLLDFSDPVTLPTALLDRVVTHVGQGNPQLEMDIVDRGVVVDANFCARGEHGPGISRVVRRTLPRWEEQGRRFLTTVWTDTLDGARALGPRERNRVFSPAGEPSDAEPAPFDPRLVVPWRSTVVLVEVPRAGVCPSLAALGEMSGNTLSLVGYDTTPILIADSRPPDDAEDFAGYLMAVKHAHRVAGISVSATIEFAGFADALAAQGLTGPSVTEVLLPGEPPAAGPVESEEPAVVPPARTPGRLHVLCVGTMDHRKNHFGVLHAAERMWRSGLDFDLTFIGHPGPEVPAFDRAYERSRAAGRPVVHLGRVSDQRLAEAYAEADFTVFLSHHEGFGLPVAESLACGTPVLTADYGSLAEIAEGGGALTVDPRDDDAVAAAFRRLLTEPELRERLRDEALARPTRTWDDYAAELWAELVPAGEGS